MTAIWKAVLKAADLQDVEAPEGAEFLTAREQHDNLCVWFKCDPDRMVTRRRIRICGTGHELPVESARYIGTGFLHNSQLVMHVFEIL